MAIDPLILEAQEALDDLMQENRLPFTMKVGMVVGVGPSQYSVRFFDSRLHSVTVTWETGQSFKDLVRSAVLEEVRKMPGHSRYQ